MDMNQFQQFLDVVKIGLKGEGKGGTIADGGRRILERKSFSRLEIYAGDEKKFREWFFNIQIIVNTSHKYAKAIMEEVIRIQISLEAGSSEVLGTKVIKEVNDEVDLGERGAPHDCGAVYKKLASELFEELCLLTTSEANTLVRAADRQDWVVALKKLQQRFNGKSPARMLRMLHDIIRPEEIKMVKGMVRGLEVWEMKVRDFEQEYGTQLGEQIKLARIIGMAPKEMQDEIYRDPGDLATTGKFGEVRDRMKRVANNRISQETPTPMDIGQVHSASDWGGHMCAPPGIGYTYTQAVADGMPRGLWGTEEAFDTLEVDYVGAGGQCYRCGGKGHMAKDCATAKGKGIEGDKGKGKGYKGYGKDGGKNKGGGGLKGGGKGDYATGKGGKMNWPQGRTSGGQLICYTCGGKGHKSDSCWKGVHEVSTGQADGDKDNDKEIEAVEIGGVWMISAVEVMNAINLSVKKTSRMNFA